MERKCGFCGHPITETERTITTYRGICCEICTEKIEALTPTDEIVIEV